MKLKQDYEKQPFIWRLSAVTVLSFVESGRGCTVIFHARLEFPCNKGFQVFTPLKLNFTWNCPYLTLAGFINSCSSKHWLQEMRKTNAGPSRWETWEALPHGRKLSIFCSTPMSVTVNLHKFRKLEEMPMLNVYSNIHKTYPFIAS